VRVEGGAAEIRRFLDAIAIFPPRPASGPGADNVSPSADADAVPAREAASPG
jgi:hypothetical protein